MWRREEIMNAKKIGNRLRELRGELPVEYVAKALNVAVSTVYMWETGGRIPRDEMKMKIATLFKSSVDDIFFKP